ncbi:enoyl-CoA hydratase/isomerase family protein [Lentzea sp. CC55]|uniref:enoyl-CoA hydratase/isomerase family protein n=1 Tax=Lentzea sp. CC55 TaxID=2884909 RepID=UPI001F2B6BBD|nr:enoyl-CoA hydratase/isomerase family protein [Lentzea sp. CC55]MCG8928066.1 enoyl-CoA hydratase/isomerase family protein [Lentzea sp. CC55]
MTSDGLRVVPKPGHLVLELDDVESRNALTPALIAQLHAALDQAEADPGCRAVVLLADGPVFSAGAHITELGEAEFKGLTTGLWHLLTRMSSGPLPTVAVMQGWASGGGVGLAAACDVVIASPEVTLQLTEVFFGMLPTIIMPWIARRVGEHRSLRLAMLADQLTAAESERIGLVDVVSDDPRAAMRKVLLSLRRSDRDTLADLKQAHQALFPADNQYGLMAERVFGARLNDPKVSQRIKALVTEGLL